MILEKLGICLQKTEIWTLSFILYKKSNKKSVKDPTMRTEIVKLPEESAGEALQRTDIGNDSWNKVPKNTGERPEINK